MTALPITRDDVDEFDREERPSLEAVEMIDPADPFASDSEVSDFDESFSIAKVYARSDVITDQAAEVEILALGRHDGARSITMEITLGRGSDRVRVPIDDIAPAYAVALLRALTLAVARGQRLGIVPTASEIAEEYSRGQRERGWQPRVARG